MCVVCVCVCVRVSVCVCVSVYIACIPYKRLSDKRTPSYYLVVLTYHTLYRNRSTLLHYSNFQSAPWTRVSHLKLSHGRPMWHFRPQTQLIPLELHI